MAALVVTSIGSILLDCSVSEQHNAEVDVTDHPVENGVNITDHARPKPETVQIEGIISATPIPAPNTPTTQRVTNTGLSYSSRGALDDTLVSDAYSSLRALKDGGQLVTVVTSLRSYDNMLITSLSVPRDARTGQVLRFSATLKQIKLVSAQTVQIQKKNTSLGKKAAVKTPDAEKNASTLDKLSNTKAGDGVMKFLGLRQ